MGIDRTALHLSYTNVDEQDEQHREEGLPTFVLFREAPR